MTSVVGGSERIRVVIADDQGIVRAGLRMIVDHEPDMVAVAEAADGVEAVEAVARCQPDVILMDLRLPRLDGLEVTRRITGGIRGSSARGALVLSSRVRSAAAVPAGRSCAVLVLTSFADEDIVLGAIRAGASGFLLKDAGPYQLAEAIRVVHRGGSMLAPALTRTLMSWCLELESSLSPDPGPARVRLPPLSQRERDVLLGLAQGLSNRGIAKRLFLRETTVKSHVSRLLAKLGLESRLQAVVLAYESGLVAPGTRAPVVRSVTQPWVREGRTA